MSISPLSLLHPLFLLSAQEPVPPVPMPQQSAAVEDATPLPVRVNRAIVRGVDWLRRDQKPDGSWAWFGDYGGGATALAAYTLVKSGVRRNDETLLRALAYCDRATFDKTYAASVHLMLLAALKDPAREPQARRDLQFLLDIQSTSANEGVAGLWNYPGAHLDMSNVQYALLGLRAAHQLGLEVPESALVEAARNLWRFQEESGGFVYTWGAPPTAGMTAATLGGLAILEEIGGGSPALAAALKKHAKDRAAAEKWMIEHYRVDGDPVGPRAFRAYWHYAYLYALERWCGLTGREKIGEHDWYQEGAAYLVAAQGSGGAWDEGRARTLADTCWALLFLRRATVTHDEELDLLYKKLDAAKAAENREAKPDPQVPFIREWLLAGPWPGPTGNVLIGAPPFEVAKAQPKEKTRVAKRDWERVTLQETGATDLEQLTQRGGDHMLWALATRLNYVADVTQAPLSATLWFNFEDGWNVFLDGRQIAFSQRVSAVLREDVRVPIELSPGEHLLLVLVEDYEWGSPFSCRITDEQGRRLIGSLRIGPDPAAKP